MDKVRENILLFKERLKASRKEKGYTQEQFAEKLCVSVDCVKNWEQTNRNTPKIENLFKICEVLECDIDYLFGRMDSHTHEVNDICEKIGLNETAVQNLIAEKKLYDDLVQYDLPTFPYMLNALNVLLQEQRSVERKTIIESIGLYLFLETTKFYVQTEDGMKQAYNGQVVDDKNNSFLDIELSREIIENSMLSRIQSRLKAERRKIATYSSSNNKTRK